MHQAARFTLTICFGILIILMGCSSNENGGTQPRLNSAPTVEFTSQPLDSLYYDESITFTWQGNDPDNNLAGFYAGLDGNIFLIQDTVAIYSGFEKGDSHIFSLFAQDDQGLPSNILDHEFGIYPYDPPNRPPSVTITSSNPDSIFFNEAITFVWQGTDPDGNLEGYYAGLDGNYDYTADSSMKFQGFELGTSYTFNVYAVDDEGLISDTASATFATYPNPPDNLPPEITLISGVADTIFYNEPAQFIWSVEDYDNNLLGSYMGLDGDYTFTTDTVANFSDFQMGSSHVFNVYAEDEKEARSETLSVAFEVYDYEPLIFVAAAGEGVTDTDQDGYWSEFNIRWMPFLPETGQDVQLRLSLMPTFGSGSEVVFTSDIVSRPGWSRDTLDFVLPTITKNLYDIKVELLDASSNVLDMIDYGTLGSLTQVGLEEFDGFFAWFDDAWTDNAVDEDLDDYFESIEIWWDVDANPDAGMVKVVVYERNSANEERQIYESYTFEVDGLGNEDASGVLITAGTTFDDYDYRLVLLDQQNNIIDELNYGEDPDLMDIQLGNSGGFTSLSQALKILK